MRNYGDQRGPFSEDPFPFYYPRTVLADEARIGTGINFVPQAAVVFLGSNDYGTEPTPQAGDFVKAYRAFLSQCPGEGRG